MDSLGPAAAFFGGLMTAFTPCVYPVIPLTVAAFGARTGSLWRRAALAAVFSGSMAGLYGTLGAVAALGGQMFGELASHPAVKLAGGALIIVLGVGLLGLYALQLPLRVRNALARLGAKRGPWVQAMVLGAVSGVLAASCTGPVLGALLVAVGGSGEASMGVSLLFLYALGMSLPFFVFAVVLEKLPRPGRWLETVKLVLGSAVVASGIAIALSAFPRTISVLPQGSAALATAGILVAGAVALQLLSKSRLANGTVPALLAIVGFLLILPRLFAPAAFSTTTEIPWDVVSSRASLAQSLARAKSARRPALVEVYAGWCADCHDLDATVFAREDVRRTLSRFASIRLDASELNDELRGIMSGYGVKGYPSLVFYASDGTLRPELTLRGVRPPKEILSHLDTVP